MTISRPSAIHFLACLLRLVHSWISLKCPGRSQATSDRGGTTPTTSRSSSETSCANSIIRSLSNKAPSTSRSWWKINYRNTIWMKLSWSSRGSGAWTCLIMLKSGAITTMVRFKYARPMDKLATSARATTLPKTSVVTFLLRYRPLVVHRKWRKYRNSANHLLQQVLSKIRISQNITLLIGGSKNHFRPRKSGIATDEIPITFFEFIESIWV